MSSPNGESFEPGSLADAYDLASRVMLFMGVTTLLLAVYFGVAVVSSIMEDMSGKLETFGIMIALGGLGGVYLIIRHYVLCGSKRAASIGIAVAFIHLFLVFKWAFQLVIHGTRYFLFGRRIQI